VSRNRKYGLCFECGTPCTLPGQRCRACHHLNLAKNKKTREQKRLWNAQWRQKVRDETFAAYGGYVCRCCGETERVFLSLDHINNDGNIDRRRFGGPDIYWRVRKLGFPPGYQVLCFNCNWAKSHGGCPHASSIRASA
jgi:hypothetical protein